MHVLVLNGEGGDDDDFFNHGDDDVFGDGSDIDGDDAPMYKAVFLSEEMFSPTWWKTRDVGCCIPWPTTNAWDEVRLVNHSVPEQSEEEF